MNPQQQKGPKGLGNLNESGRPYMAAQRFQAHSPTAMQIMPAVARHVGGVVQAPINGLHSLAPRFAPNFSMFKRGY